MQQKTLRLHPLQLLEICKDVAHIPGFCLLFSTQQSSTSKQCFFSCFPSEKFTILPQNNDPWHHLDTFIHQKVKTYPFFFPVWMGYLSYELGAYIDDSLNYQPKTSLPLASFYKGSIQGCLDLATHTLTLSYTPQQENSSFLQSILKKPYDPSPALHTASIFPLELTQTSDTYVSYKKKIQKIQKLILDGGIK